MNMKKRALFVSALLIVSILAFFIFRPGPPISKDTPALNTNRGFKWRAGEILLYHLSQTGTIQLESPIPATRLLIDNQTTGPGSRSEDFSTEADMLVRVGSITENEIALHIGLFNVQSRTGTESSEVLSSILSKPALYYFSPDGRFLRSEMPNQIAAEDTFRLSDLIQSLQVTYPADKTPTWQADESDSLGKYLARYSLSETAPEIQRSKLRYLSLNATEGAFDQITLSASNTSFMASRSSSWYEHFRSDEALELKLEGVRQIASNIRSTLERRPLATDFDLPDWAKQETHTFLAGLKKGERLALSPLLEQRQQLKRSSFLQEGASVESLSSSLKGDLKASDILERAAELADFLKLFPDNEEEVLSLLKQDGYQEGLEGSRLIYALQLAETDSAQQALRVIVEEPAFSLMNKQRALIALGQMPLNQELESFLWNLAESGNSDPQSKELASMSVLALGASAKFLNQSGQAKRSESITKQLTHVLDQATQNNQYEEAALYVSALGNTFREDAGNAILPSLLGSDADEVRLAAAEALHAISSPLVDRSLIEQLLKEDAAAVRKAIVGSLLERAPSDEAVASVLQVAFEEDSRDARALMAKYLLSVAPEFPVIQDGIQDLMAMETDPDIYQTLAAALVR